MTVTHILRYPLKSHGREALERVSLINGQAMPWDRVWAIAHDAAKITEGEWASCANFSRVSKAPMLTAITSTLDEASETLTLTHPDRPPLSFHPDREAEAFLEWVMPLVPQNRALPQQIVRLDGRGYTDSDFPSVTLCSLASHKAVESQIGQALSIHRWRGNLWFDDHAAWAERDWIGKQVRIGGCLLRVRENTDRCLATTSNPDTGQRDADILGTLDHWGHQDFSVRAEVIESGPVTLGDAVEVLS